ncbi:hypothetical protein KJ765_05080 [Candidatus Micrarchaeota archaeon]|nr:hypothetical protein [Candidatus Micrarchaeota archaeon]
MRGVVVCVVLSLTIFFPSPFALDVSLLNFSRVPALSFNLFLIQTNASIEIPASNLSLLTHGEVSLLSPFLLNTSLSQNASYLISNASFPLYSASGGLALVIEDGCTDYYGQDLCERAGFTGPGDFSWCDECDYFNPNCGNYYLKDWCYRYRPFVSTNYSNLSELLSFDFSIQLNALNSSCTASVNHSSCNDSSHSLTLINYSLNTSQPNHSFINLSDTFGLLSPTYFQNYLSAWAYYQSHYFLSIPDAVASTSQLTAAYHLLIETRSGNYSNYYDFSPPDSWVSAHLSARLNDSAVPFLFLHGNPRILNVSKHPILDGLFFDYSASLENIGFVDDTFSLQLSCTNHSGVNTSVACPSHSNASFFLNLENVSFALNCTVFAFSENNSFLNHSLPILLQLPIPSPTPPPSIPPSSSSTSTYSSSPIIPVVNSPTPTILPSPSFFPSAAPSSIPLQYARVPLVIFLMPASIPLGVYPITLLDDGVPPKSPIHISSPSGRPYRVLLSESRSFNFSEPGYWKLQYSNHSFWFRVLPRPSSSPYPSSVPSRVSGLLALSFSWHYFLLIPLLLLAIALHRFPQPPIHFTKTVRDSRVTLYLKTREPLHALMIEDFAPSVVSCVPSPSAMDDTVLGMQLQWCIPFVERSFTAEYSLSNASQRLRSAQLTAILKGKRVRLTSTPRYL